MFLHMLNEDQQIIFLKLAKLVCISDDNILWDGKSENEVTSETNLNAMTLQESEHEGVLLAAFVKECSLDDRMFGNLMTMSRAIEVQKAFIENLKMLPLGKQNAPEERIQAASVVMSGLLGKLVPETLNPCVPKIMLYELMLLALADGMVSSVECVLLKNLSVMLKVEEFIYDDLMDRAKAMNVEAGKTLSLILE